MGVFIKYFCHILAVVVFIAMFIHIVYIQFYPIT